MSFYFIYQHKPKGSTFDKPLHASSAFPTYELAKRQKQIQKTDKECVFSEIIEADSEEEAIQKVDPSWLNRV